MSGPEQASALAWTPPNRVNGRRAAAGAPSRMAVTHRTAREVLRCLGPGPQVPADVVARLDALCEVREVRAGEVVVRAGEPLEAVHLVLTGELAMSLRTTVGSRRIVSLVHPREVVGDVSLLTGGPLRFHAVAVAASRIVTVDRRGLVGLLGESAELGLRWLGSATRRLATYQERVLTLLHKDLARQVATVLLLEQERAPSGERVVRLAHATIAQLLGASRQSITRVVHDLRRWGLVEPGYRRLTLLDLEGLALVAQGRRLQRRDEPAAG